MLTTRTYIPLVAFGLVLSSLHTACSDDATNTEGATDTHDTTLGDADAGRTTDTTSSSSSSSSSSGALPDASTKDATPTSCANVTCKTPPAATCTDATTLQAFAANGTCNAGSCSYAKSAPVSCLCRSGACTKLGSELLSVGAFDHVCALTASDVECWGRNDYGQLGASTGKISYVPVRSGFGRAVAVATGSDATCAIDVNGGLRCAGFNGFGGLGDGTTKDSSTPVNVLGLGSGVAQVSVGSSSACAVTTAGGVKCWGRNVNGNLGNGTYVDAKAPVDVTGLASGVLSVSTHFSFSCALLATGGVKCWGDNTNGKLGNGAAVGSAIPVDVVGLSGPAKGIATGFQHACALLQTGNVQCWGWNEWGQLGTGTLSKNSSVPVDVSGLTNVTSLSTSGYNTCATNASGAVLCWGGNTFGQLGTGTNATRSPQPLVVAGLASGFDGVTSGEGFVCAHATSGEVKCLGSNSYGALGNNGAAQGTAVTTVFGF